MLRVVDIVKNVCVFRNRGSACLESSERKETGLGGWEVEDEASGKKQGLDYGVHRQLFEFHSKYSGKPLKDFKL